MGRFRGHLVAFLVENFFDVASAGAACDFLGGGIVDSPLGGGLGDGRGTSLTVMCSTSMDLMRLYLMSWGMIDSFLLRR